MRSGYPGLVAAVLAGLMLAACVSGLVGQKRPSACAIHMTQHGFSPDGPQRAIVSARGQAPLPYSVRDAGGRVVASGETWPHGADEASGENLHIIDIAAPLPVGEGYVLSACNGESRPFRVAEGLYAGLAEDALLYFYHNRIGTPIEQEYVQGPEWARPAAHPSVLATCFEGKDMAGNDWPGCDYRLDVTGSWFDAGDFGVYAVNKSVTIWTLLSAYERLRAQGLVEAAGWADGRIKLPETGNGVSEILDEARWGMETLLAMQVPDGAKVWVAGDGQEVRRNRPAQLTQIDAGGLVHHKLAGRAWPPLPMWPWDDTQERVLYPPSTAATLGLAATGAQCARLWAGIDDDFAGRCFGGAQRAYAAAKKHPDILASGQFDGSGGYGDRRLEDEFAWAAAELYLTTGDPAYLVDLQANEAFGNVTDSFGWSDVDMMPVISLALHGEARNRTVAALAREVLLEAAASSLAVRDAEGYRVPLRPSEYVWGSNSVVLNRGLILAAAYDLTADPVFRDGAVDAMDYVLGRNVLDQSYVSGYGARPMQAPHHRIWAAAADPSFPPPPPGALSGGPNNRNMADPVARKMRGRCAPMACWQDHVDAYALNEVAINWNAPLAAMAIFLDQTEKTFSLQTKYSYGE